MMVVSKDAWQTDAGELDVSNSLEREQSQTCEEQRSLDEGDEAGLTELAAPKVAPEHETGDDLEQEEEETEERENRERTSTDEDDALAEVAAPAPITHMQRLHGSDTSEVKEKLDESASVNRQQPPRWWMELVTVSWLAFFSILGTLARLGIEAVATYPYAIVLSTVLWANMGGSFLMGFLLEDRQLFRSSAESSALGDDRGENNRHIDKKKKTIPLYIGLTTGFCGSFTSFSTFITDAFRALDNSLPPPSVTSPYRTLDVQSMSSRNGGYSFAALLAVLIIHPAISLAALKTGAHTAVGMERVTPVMPLRFIRKILDPLGVVLGVGCWIGAVLLVIWSVQLGWPRSVTMSLIFAPAGALSRFYISKHLNARVPWFPLGTFAINVFGTCIEGMCYDLQHSTSIIGNTVSKVPVTCAVLEGVMQGYCGCATTVSTWVVELNALRRRHAWFYGTSSVVVSLGLQIAIMGSVAWTSGFGYKCNS